jgi:hypothetical protein
MHISYPQLATWLMYSRIVRINGACKFGGRKNPMGKGKATSNVWKKYLTQ